MPVTVPPVPMPATKCVTRPRVCSQISGRGRVVLRLGIVGVVVLVGLPGQGDLAGQAVRHRVVRLGVLGRHRGGTHHDLGSVGAQQGDLLGTHLVGADEDAAVAPTRRHDGEPDAGVAARRLHDRPARLEELPVSLGRLDHGERDAVLRRAARVEHLELGDERALEVAGGAVQPDHRACGRSARPGSRPRPWAAPGR